MSSTLKQAFGQNRPRGFAGRGDKYLADHAQDLRRLLAKTQLSFEPAARLPERPLQELALVLVEFAEDIHNNIGLWRTLEAFNQESFGNPLPLTCEPGVGALEGFDARRIQHLLWQMWNTFFPTLLFSPTHPALRQLAECAAPFLTERFARLPQDSGIQRFLNGPSRFAWEVKDKLLWLGTQSYLFRALFADYVRRHGEAITLSLVDDFATQECTHWSGLGAIDFLAGILNLTEPERVDLRHWYIRHVGPYRITARHENNGQVETVEAINLVTRQPYIVRMQMADCPFQANHVVFGALTPWRGEWYWSGEQRYWQDLPAAADEELMAGMLQDNASLVYRYCPEVLAQAREVVRQAHADFVARHGSDLVVFPDGPALAAALQERLDRAVQATVPPHPAASPDPSPPTETPKLRLPQDILDCKQGIGLFHNPDEGEELMLEFEPIVAGFKKRGVDLSEEEAERIRMFTEGTAISPAFVMRLVQEHGAESIGKAYLVEQFRPEADLPYLLRRHKGQYYRQRYPNMRRARGA